MDIEGWEVDALAGAEVLIRRDRPVMWIEVNAAALQARGYDSSELVALIQGSDYDVTAGTGEIGGPQWDALCLPR
jgi:multidrug efflux pump subunit AcrB